MSKEMQQIVETPAVGGNREPRTISEDHIYNIVKYILEKEGEMTAMKLHKLLYYCQAWSLVWDERPLFAQEIQAWANGPVVPIVYQQHKGQFKVAPKDPWAQKGDIRRLTKEQKDTIDAVLRFYGSKSPDYLIRLTHNEDPWREARRDVPIGERSNNIISTSSMAEYYAGLLA